jgi:hypothetical protein
VQYSLTLTPVNRTFIYPVSLSVSGLPNGVTATLTPSSIATGAGVSTVALTLDTSSQARLEKSNGPWGGTGAVLALLFLPLAFTRRFRRSCARLSRSTSLLLALLVLAAFGVLSGCGSGGFFGQTNQSYTVTVTAVSGPTTHTSSVTLNVQ